MGARNFEGSILEKLIYKSEKNAISSRNFAVSSGNWKVIEVNEDNKAFKVIDNMLYSIDEKKLVKVPSGVEGEFSVKSGVTELGGAAVAFCKKISKVIIDNDVKTIGTDAFSDDTGIEEVIIGKNVESLGSSAFIRCSNIKKIKIEDGLNSMKAKRP